MLFREIGDKEGIAWALLELANLHFCSQGDPAKVHTLIEEGMALCKEIGHKEGVNWALSLFVEVFLQEGNAVKARLLLEEATALSREIGHRHATAEALFLLGKVLALEGDLAAARTHYEESLARGRETGDDLNIPSYLEGLAVVVADQGESLWAAQLWGKAETLREAMGTPIPPVYRAGYERAVATARAQLDEKAFAAAWAEGRTMTLDQVLNAPAKLPPAPSNARPVEAMVQEPPVRSPKPAPLVSVSLTPREMDVLRLLAQGLTSAQVAEQLVIGVVTVNFHVRSIYSKLGVTSRAAATRYALKHGLV
jgi:DNA-binding CsgD family transcriptional regulator/tetratricopeptide (TPR) repeat protein